MYSLAHFGAWPGRLPLFVCMSPLDTHHVSWNSVSNPVVLCGQRGLPFNKQVVHWLQMYSHISLCALISLSLCNLCMCHIICVNKTTLRPFISSKTVFCHKSLQFHLQYTPHNHSDMLLPSIVQGCMVIFMKFHLFFYASHKRTSASIDKRPKQQWKHAKDPLMPLYCH